LVLLVTGVGFIGFGGAYAVWPQRMAAVTDVALPTPTARADFAATYGGFQLGFGVFLIACTRQAAWLEPGLWAAGAALAGLATLRGVGLLLSGGQVRRSIWFGLGLELIGVGLNAWALGRLG
jgi:hypothetical protein